MKTKLPIFLAQIFFVAALILCFFGWLAQSATENGSTLLYYYGGLLTILYLAGRLFKRAYMWEIAVGRIAQSMSGPVSYGYLYSSLIMKIFGIIMTLLLITALLSISDRYNLWLGNIWAPLQIVSGWPTFLSSLLILFILMISYFIRDNQCYQPKVRPSSEAEKSEMA